MNPYFAFDRQFEDLAVGVLRIYDKNTRECVNDVLVIRYIRDLEMDSLELAVHCKCDRFVSNSTVQSILDNIWRGKTNDTSHMVIGIVILLEHCIYLVSFRLKERKSWRDVKQATTELNNTCKKNLDQDYPH